MRLILEAVRDAEVLLDGVAVRRCIGHTEGGIPIVLFAVPGSVRAVKPPLALESTGEIVTVGGVRGRVWQGRGPAGIPVLVVLHRVAVREDLDQRGFRRESLEMLPPGEVS